jgi:uncharacterized protein involved in response to NO
VTTSAVARIAASVSVDGYDLLIWIAGAAWIAAFGSFFLALYGPMLLRPRIDGRPG